MKPPICSSAIMPISYLLIVLFVSTHDSLPYRSHLTTMEPKARASRDTTNSLVGATEDSQGPTDCSSNAHDAAGDCNHESADGRLSPKMMLCLNNCANCVKQWRAGVYNGRNCADDCMQEASNEQPSESMDPDCSLIKYFNATLLSGAA